MKNRIVNNWITTILGVLILGYCMVMLSRGQNWEDLIGFFGMASLLLRSKDSLIGLEKKDK